MAGESWVRMEGVDGEWGGKDDVGAAEDGERKLGD